MAPKQAARPPRRRTANPADNWSRMAPVYDVNGPRVRLGIAWFATVVVAVLLSSVTAGLVYAVAAGLAARQTVLAWKSPQLHADVATGLAAVPVLAAVLGTGPATVALIAAAAVALGLAVSTPPGAGLVGGVGRAASAGILLQATLPVAIAAGAVVVVRDHSPIAAIILVGLVSAYEMGDYLVGSGASNPVEGPLAGAAAVVVVGFPMALLLLEPFDVMGVAMLGVAAVCCPVGQWIASAVLPQPGANAPALRRIDTLLLLAPIWAVAAGALG